MTDKKRPPFENRIETVSVGETVYISYENIIVTEIGIFIHVFSEILFESEINKKQIPKEIIPITRIGSGLNRKNWKLNKAHAVRYCLCVETEKDAEDYLNKVEKGKYVYFPKRRKKEPQPPKLPKEIIISNNIEKLEIELNDSITEELFEKAAKIRDKLKRLRKKQIIMTKPLVI